MLRDAKTKGSIVAVSWVGMLQSAMASQKSKKHSTLTHLFAGGIGGAAGAIVTSPFDVIKTRLQSSGYRLNVTPQLNIAGTGTFAATARSKPVSAVMSYMRFMVKSEGWQSLFRGLELQFIGTAPARAIYFAVYSKSKRFFTTRMDIPVESPLVPIFSSVVAGFTTCTATNPIWFIKTRLQLENSRCQGYKRNILRTIRDIYTNEGLRKFYSGLTASYLGIAESVINFLIYEQLKLKINKHYNRDSNNSFYTSTFLVASMTSKSTAAIIGYPHEVLRTRLRQQSNKGKRKYHSVGQTAATIFKEEGWLGFYGGLWTHLLRQVPNTVILFVTYEAIVHYFEK